MLPVVPGLKDEVDDSVAKSCQYPTCVDMPNSTGLCSDVSRECDAVSISNSVGEDKNVCLIFDEMLQFFKKIYTSSSVVDDECREVPKSTGVDHGIWGQMR
jgi:hypothetical protein